jgi:ubiquinone/menaquinone biosynthesis C-methylase UbiE
MAGIPEKAWPNYVKEVFRVLKPGSGVAIFTEMNPSTKSDSYDVSKTHLRQVFHNLCYVWS